MADIIELDFDSTKAKFFTEVEQIIGPALPGKTMGRGRWRRGAGSGRYANRGVIRYYSHTYIHVIFYNPTINLVFGSHSEALVELGKILNFSK